MCGTNKLVSWEFAPQRFPRSLLGATQEWDVVVSVLSGGYDLESQRERDEMSKSRPLYRVDIISQVYQQRCAWRYALARSLVKISIVSSKSTHSFTDVLSVGPEVLQFLVMWAWRTAGLTRGLRDPFYNLENLPYAPTLLSRYNVYILVDCIARASLVCL